MASGLSTLRSSSFSPRKGNRRSLVAGSRRNSELNSKEAPSEKDEFNKVLEHWVAQGEHTLRPPPIWEDQEHIRVEKESRDFLERLE